MYGLGVSTATFTDLLRQPKEVAAQTDSGVVRITRRDAEDLVLLRAGDLEDQNRGIALASRIMRATLACQGNMVAALESLFAWTREFSPQGLVEFAAEIERLVWAAAELGTYGRLLHAFESWEGTAEALAEGLEPLSDDVLLPVGECLDIELPQ